MTWLFAACADCQRMGFVESGAFSLRSLQPANGKRGILDLLLFKKTMRDYLVDSWMNQKAFPDAVKASIRQVTATHAAYRSMLRPYSMDLQGNPLEPNPVNLEWKKGWPRSCELFLQLVEAVAFDTEFDPSLKNGIKNRKAPDELLEYVQFKEKVVDIETALEKESNRPPTETAATDAHTVTGGAAGSTQAQGSEGQKDDDEDKVNFDRHWRDYAARVVDSYCKFFSEPQTETQLAQLLKNTDMSKTSKGVKGSDCVAALFTCGLSSEAITDPHLRGAPFKKERVLSFRVEG